MTERTSINLVEPIEAIAGESVPIRPNRISAQTLQRRTTLWAWGALGGGVASFVVWGVWASLLNAGPLSEHPLGYVLLWVLGIAGWYLGIAGIVSHFFARRAVFASEKTEGEEIQGDFTALLGFLISVGSLMLWNQGFGPLRVILVLAFVGLRIPEEEAVAWARYLDALVSAGLILVSFAYAAIGGPGAMRRLLIIGFLLLFPLALFSQYLVRGRDNQRATLGEHRLGNLGRAMQEVQQDHRRFPRTGPLKSNP